MRQYVGFTPHPKQRQIIQSVIHSTAKFHIANIGRQFGKSLMGQNLLLWWAINDGPCKILWVSPVYSQTSKVQKELFNAIQGSGLVKTCNMSSNEMSLHNGTEIIFRSAERYDNIRGGTYDYAIIDEAAFMKDEAWKEAIRPTLLVRGKKVLFISTPKGRNWFYELFQLGLSQDYPNYISYTGSSYDTPYIADEEIEDAKRTLPEAVFRQEYLAEFIEGGGEVFTDLQRLTFDKWPKGQGPYYAGCDIARAQDYTVMTVMDSQGKVVEVYRQQGTSWSTMVDDMVKLARKWQASVLVEENGVGSPIFELLKSKWSNTHPWITSSKSKQEIIEGLILDCNEGGIEIPSKDLFPPLYHEMTVFTYDYNPKTRSIRYGHPDGMHDDTVMSLAIANYWRKQRKSFGTYKYVSR
jgi:hypothetical protein